MRTLLSLTFAALMALVVGCGSSEEGPVLSPEESMTRIMLKALPTYDVEAVTPIASEDLLKQFKLSSTSLQMSFPGGVGIERALGRIRENAAAATFAEARPVRLGADGDSARYGVRSKSGTLVFVNVPKPDGATDKVPLMVIESINGSPRVTEVFRSKLL